ncbi:MAG: replication-associated recombination protein A [Ruminococcaceae bacterium]|nr:replication-associated recombination protein A [Oscillospiraceae bacterium]MBR3596132.1 replication-associated recombination protein A [Clostridia bacterium]
MSTPLADRIRPKNLDEISGQRHLFSKGAVLRNIIESGNIPNLIFYGPSGTGKTTVARIIAAATNKRLHILNGTSASLSDVKEVIGEINTIAAPNGLLLYLDEIQYFNKKQQQSLLQYIENGDITLVASTTENPYFYIYSAVLSRSTVFEFKSISPEDAEPGIERAFAIMSEDTGEEYETEDGVISYIAQSCGGDMRKAANIVELTVLGSMSANGGEKKKITLDTVKQITAKTAMHYDRQGDEYYDMLSAYQKSMRGSDPDAALHYLARILEAGDLISATRRLMVCACEDVGLAYPMIIPIVKSACDIAMQVGLPEARIPLADAVILVCNSPKSNSGEAAIDAALSDVRAGLAGPVPRHLQNKHFDGEDALVKGQHYKYPHDAPNHWLKQQYLPDNIKHRTYYTYGDNKTEQAAKEYWSKIKK